MIISVHPKRRDEYEVMMLTTSGDSYKLFVSKQYLEILHHGKLDG